MPLFTELQMFKAAVILATLALGSYMDLKKREIEDKVWVIGGIAGLPITILQLVSGPELAPAYLLSIGVTLLIVVVLAYADMMGGADLKAFIMLALLELPSSRTRLTVFPAISVLVNSVFFSLSMVLFIFLRNIKKIIRDELHFGEDMGKATRLIVLLSSYREKLGRVKAEPHKYFIMERVENGRRVFRSSVKASVETTELIRKLEASGVKDDEEVWVSPTIPMIAFIFIGYIAYLFLGDVVTPFLRFILVRKT